MDAYGSTDDLRPPTPAFVIDRPALERCTERWFSALREHWPNSILGYSFKTNSLPWLIAFMKNRGAWAEVVSESEYTLALALGYEADRIVCNGQSLGRERLRSALLGGTILNLDAKREVRWAAELARERPGRLLRVGLRVNWDLELLAPSESTAGPEGSRFGFNVSNGEFDAALDELTEAGVRVAGLQVHRNTKSQSLAAYRAAAAVAADLVTSRGLELDWVDIGGGFYGHSGQEPDRPTIEDYVRTIRDELETTIDPRRTQLIVEPGGSIIAAPVEFHTSVLDVKDVGEHTFVGTDGSRANIDPLFRRERSYLHLLQTAATGTRPHQVVSGYTFVEADRIMRLVDAPALTEGDRIVYYKVGAYTMSLASNFIEYLPAVYVRDATSLMLVRRKWTAAEYVQASALTEDAGVEPTAPTAGRAPQGRASAVR